MVRVHFNLVRRDEIIPDGEGIDVDDIQQAVFEVIDTAKELQQKDPSSRNDWSGWTASIADEGGSVLATIPLETTAH